MEKFNFDYYKDSIKRIKCIYTYEGEIREDTSWEGFIYVRNIDGLLYIEGYEMDKMDSLEKNGYTHLRYILGNRAISYADESLEFVIYPSRIAPIYYDMQYNKDDECFYGKWKHYTTINHPHPYDGGSGLAIIHIEDVIVDEIRERDIIKRIADRSKKEYSEEIETFNFISNYQISLGNDDNYPQSVKKLSKFSNDIKW